MLWGLFFCVIFTVASAYSGLKVGQVMEAAIPISILAIGLARIYRAALDPARERDHHRHRRRVGCGRGGRDLHAAGALHPEARPASVADHLHLPGGRLPRRAVPDSAAPLLRARDARPVPYPEATAITEVLVTGEKGGSQAKLLLQATCIAGVYDFFVTTFQVWKEYVDFQFVPVVRAARRRGAHGVQLRRDRLHPGPGLRDGPARAMILCAGGVLSNFVLVPLIWMMGSHVDMCRSIRASMPIAQMTAAQIFRSYVRFIGVGAIATAGIFGIVKSLRVIAGSFGIALRAFREGEGRQAQERTDRDIPIMAILIGVVVERAGGRDLSSAASRCRGRCSAAGWC